jgi:plasmid stabilization system protein ParE
MTRWLLAAQAEADLERLTEFLLLHFPEYAFDTVDIVLNALEILTKHPQIGRPLPHGLRELVISRGASGYLALYQYDQEHDIALVMRVRHQRENGYAPS